MIGLSKLTSTIRISVPTDVRDEANDILNKLGLSMSTAINVFLRKVILERGIPFEINKPKVKKTEKIDL